MDISRFLASSIMDLRSMARGVAREPKPRSSRGVFLCGRALSRVRDGGRRASCARNTDRTVGGQLSRGAAQKRKFLVARPVSKNVTGEFHRAKTHPWWVHRKHHRSTDQLPSEAKRDFHLNPHIAGRHRSRPGQIPRVASHPPRRERFVVAREKNDLRILKKEDRASELPRARSRPTPFRLQTSYRTSVRALEMDRSIRAKFPDDDHVLGPFLGNLPSEILDVVVGNLEWCQTTFAMAGKTCREAVKRVPDTDVIPFLTCEAAARDGHLEVLKWARQNGCPWGKGTCQAAAKGGHLEVLQWLRRNGCEWDENTCAWAASAGRLETLRWARENGCPWNEKACMYAAKGGHLETLMWLEENGCPTLTDAAERGGRVGESWLGVHPWCSDEVVAQLRFGRL